MAEQTAIVTSADVTARLSTQAYTRIFAKNSGSTVDTTFRDLCIAEANSEIRVTLRASFPDGLYITDDTLDPAVVGKGVDLVCAIAVSRHLSFGDDGAFAAQGRAARAFFRDLARDKDARAPGSSQGAPLPAASIANTTDENGVPTNPYVRSASSQSRTGF